MSRYENEVLYLWFFYDASKIISEKAREIWTLCSRGFIPRFYDWELANIGSSM